VKGLGTGWDLFWSLFWITWFVMLVVGDPLAIATRGERDSDTHFLVTHIGYGLRVAVLAWLAYHFLVAHIKS
jgi:hypothetical protein